MSSSSPGPPRRTASSRGVSPGGSPERAASRSSLLPRDVVIAVAHDARDLLPIGSIVQRDADPTAVADVRRHEVVLRIAAHERVLRAQRRCHPYGVVLGPVVVRVAVEEAPLLVEERSLAVAELLARIG